MITGMHIEAAEVTLKQAVNIVGRTTAIYDRIDADPQAVDRFVQHHLATFRNRSPECDKAAQNTVAALLRHAFIAGVLTAEKARPQA